jgi:predicted nucleic acid-binding protein
MFTDLAFASNVRYLITQNINDFAERTELKLDRFKIITPAEFVRRQTGID